ncbi:GNAT family N-acetyltransferase [Actinosynnema sp. NPDC053489]|uniref:GNAT family N-acetyltransferase n=1 Tax=Actinosynnema sp. NPDC053489 TaxID=3363916 RepID=UPI0037C780A0
MITDPRVADLVMAWGRGWAVSRRVPAPEEVPGGFRIDVGRPGHRVRHVLHTWDHEALAGLARRHTAPGTWIKISGTAADLREALPAPWTPADTCYLMTAPFTAGAQAPPPPYEVHFTTDGAATTATVVDDTGATAASGHLGAAGGFGTLDRVETAPQHRRRGLGTTVVRALGDHATRRGLRTGVLVATEQGRALYRNLGWTVRSEVAAAFVPER